MVRKRRRARGTEFLGGWRVLVAALWAVVSGCGRDKAAVPETAVANAEPRWCDLVPRKANTAFEKVSTKSSWFDVYRVEPGVFALVEANQFQEAVSYLIVGANRALMFDTGIGLMPIRPVVEELTTLPIEVINSHTHYDHVGGNGEFDRVLAMDLPYTRANQHGGLHQYLANEVAPESFCQGPPVGADTAGFRTKPWQASGSVADGATFDLGGRTIEVLHVPGHTPDALALLDRANGLLFTGDSYYDASIWLYVPETDLDAYERSIARMVGLAPSLKRLLPAHNTATADPARLAEVQAAIRAVREGKVKGEDQPNQQVLFRFPIFSILTSRPLLEGKHGDRTKGGSGLTPPTN